MENASEALIMAGQVLIFIIALTVCISSFTTLRIGIDEIVGQKETIRMSKNDEGYINYIDSSKTKATRVVGAETIISSMYRAIKENYVIYIITEDCESLKGTGESAVDLTEAKNDLVIGGKTVIKAEDNKKIIKVTIGNKTNQAINSKFKNGLYDKIKQLSFYEYLGEYQNNSQATTENKQIYRIITYIEKDYMDNL